MERDFFSFFFFFFWRGSEAVALTMNDTHLLACGPGPRKGVGEHAPSTLLVPDSTTLRRHYYSSQPAEALRGFMFVRLLAVLPKQ